MAGTSRELRLDAKVQDQVNGIKAAFAERKITIDYEPKDGGVSAIFVDGEILVRDEYLERVMRMLGQTAGLSQVTRVIAGIVLLTLEVAKVTPDILVDAGVKPTVVESVSTVDRVFGAGIA